MKEFKNKIVNRLWELLSGFTIWELWKTYNSRIFENKTKKIWEIWNLIEAHLKETITLIHWTHEEFTAEENEIIILYEMGIFELPINNTRFSMMPNSAISVNSWLRPSISSFKLNFDGVTKGNPHPTGFRGALRNLSGIILNMLWGSIGNNTNNMVELEGLINGISWALQKEKTLLVVEGDSQVIINIAHRLQHGATTSQVLKN